MVRVVAEARGAAFKATLSETDDEFLAPSGRVSYGHATEDLFSRNGFVTGGGIGTDYVQAIEFVAGSGNDNIKGFDRIQGGNGNDYLAPVLFAEGGYGNDILEANSSQRVELRGDSGEDTFLIFTDAKISGGESADIFVFANLAQVTINDLGRGDDKLDLGQWFQMPPEEAFEQGYIKTDIRGGYTYVSIDQDGGGDNYYQFLTLKGSFYDLGEWIY